MHNHDNDIEKLIKLLGKIPGFGKRSARRAVLHLINNKEGLMQPLISQLQSTSESIKICHSCYNVDTSDPCHICQSKSRQQHTICVVEDVADLWAIERGQFFNGVYHVLGGTLSAIDGRGPDELNIQSLLKRIETEDVTEIILATSATVEGQTTAHYLTQRLGNKDIKISQIAHGIPMGGELDYLDEGTLGAAIQARRPF